MSLDLKTEAFIFGNIDMVDENYRTVELKTLLNYYENSLLKILEKDKSFPWRVMKNFKILINIHEHYLISEEDKFYKLIDFFENFLKICDKINFQEEEKKYMEIISSHIFDIFSTRMKIYKKNNPHIILENLYERFKDRVNENTDIMFDYVSPYDDIRWTSKWKLLSKNKEITFDNIDVYHDSYFKNSNIYYNSTMCNVIKSTSERLCFLRDNSPRYFKILEKNLSKVSEVFFNIFPYNIIFNDYPYLFSFNCYLPKIMKKENSSKVRWLFSILPNFLSGYLLGIPVISMDIPDYKNLSDLVDKLEELGKEKYYDFIRDNYNNDYIKSISFGTKTGNGTDEGKIVDLCYNDICEYNQDDVAGIFNNNVIHYFTSKEFKDIIKKQENPYNRQNFPNQTKLIENLKFKNKVRRNLINKGLDIDLEGTLLENFEEVMKKISSKDVIHYFPHIEDNTDVFYRPLFEILLNSI